MDFFNTILTKNTSHRLFYVLTKLQILLSMFKISSEVMQFFLFYTTIPITKNLQLFES